MPPTLPQIPQETTPTAISTTLVMTMYRYADPASASEEISVSPEPGLGQQHQQRYARRRRPSYEPL
jgi:hypothetical protein